jgi:hypothetical protein
MAVLYINAPFQTKYSIETNCDKLVSSLRLKYGKYVSMNEDKADQTILVKKEKSAFIIHCQTNEYQTQYPLQEIDSIIFDNTIYEESIFALHGAAVEWSGKAYLFLASTTGGKTTLASYLTSAGFGYITDDCILLDRKSFEVHPYCSPIHLRDGGLAVLKKYNIEIPNLQHLDDPAINRYVYTPDNCITKPIPLSKIFLISRTENENRLVKLNSTEKMIQLMKAPITDYKVNGEYIRFITRLASNECYKLFYSNMEYVAQVICNEQ